VYGLKIEKSSHDGSKTIDTHCSMYRKMDASNMHQCTEGVY